jgi:hypothetical protein
MYNSVNAGSYVGTSTGPTGNLNGYSFYEAPIEILLGNDGTTDGNSGYYDTNNNKVYSMEMTSATSLTMEINYSSIFSTISATTESPTYFNIAPSNNGGSAPSTPILIYWLRTRAYPPNGVMPSVTFGSVS